MLRERDYLPLFFSLPPFSLAHFLVRTQRPHKQCCRDCHAKRNVVGEEEVGGKWCDGDVSGYSRCILQLVAYWLREESRVQKINTLENLKHFELRNDKHVKSKLHLRIYSKQLEKKSIKYPQSRCEKQLEKNQ